MTGLCALKVILIKYNCPLIETWQLVAAHFNDNFTRCAVYSERLRHFQTALCHYQRAIESRGGENTAFSGNLRRKNIVLDQIKLRISKLYLVRYIELHDNTSFICRQMNPYNLP